MKYFILVLSLFFGLNTFALENCNDVDPDCSYVYNGVYCGVNCKYVYNGVYCADTGKATPAQPAKKQ